MGVLSYVCVICPTEMNHDDFLVHYMTHFRDLFHIKEESPEDEPESNFRIHKVPEIEEIKVEILQANSVHSSEIKPEPRDAENSWSNEDHSMGSMDEEVDGSLNEVNRPTAKIRGRPKNSVKFVEPKECGICGEKFELRNTFKEHIRIHQCGPTPKVFKCDICGRKASKFKNLVDHFRYKHTSKVKCEICQKMIRKNYRIAHLKRHNDERNFKCMICDKAFVMAGDLTTHLKLHTTPATKNPSSKKFVDPQTCNVCGQKFVGISAYERHIQSHGTTASLYECDICGRRVKEKKNLLSHMLFRHSGMPKTKATCNICGKIFNRKYLKLHVQKHNVTNQKPSHICPICGKTFLVSADLSAHIRQHNRTTEAAPCSICGKTFASAASLADHNRVHSGERPFPCPICGSKFRTRSMLYVHRTIHLTEKNFACEICHMRFKNPAYVKTHKRKVHEKNKVPKKRL
ncbi:hypothetical protein HA402_003212 [Bradysia odoriphaga]|nr:hypothetical protein HA402_003212 [Bradysia odoriphaga]